MSTPAIDIGSLKPDERLRLIGDLWDSLRETPEDIGLTEAQRIELDRRLDSFESGKAGLVSWDDIRARLAG